jgi:hypothetical protein
VTRTERLRRYYFGVPSANQRHFGSFLFHEVKQLATAEFAHEKILLSTSYARCKCALWKTCAFSDRPVIHTTEKTLSCKIGACVSVLVKRVVAHLCSSVANSARAGKAIEVTRRAVPRRAGLERHRGGRQNPGAEVTTAASPLRDADISVRRKTDRLPHVIPPVSRRIRVTDGE